jgi:hypothetical protein
VVVAVAKAMLTHLLWAVAKLVVLAVVVVELKLETLLVALVQAQVVKAITEALVYLKTRTDPQAEVVVPAVLAYLVLALMVVMAALLHYLLSPAQQHIMLAVVAVELVVEPLV